MRTRKCQVPRDGGVHLHESAPRASACSREAVTGRGGLGLRLPPPPRLRSGADAPAGPRTGPRRNSPQRPREPADARTASGHHQCDEAADRTGGKAKGVTAIGFGEKCTPLTPAVKSWRSPGTCQERFASLRDGLRPHLTEPVRRASSVRAAANGHRWSGAEMRGRRRAVIRGYGECDFAMSGSSGFRGRPSG